MMSLHPEDVSSTLHIDKILRSGLSLFSDEVGRLWCALATYYIRLGMFECARDVYEEAIASVLTVRDFSVVFDAYVKFLEALVTAEMQHDSEISSTCRDDSKTTNRHTNELDRLLQLYEDVADRRPMLLNAVLLRQNPHSVREWQKRIALLSNPLEVYIYIWMG